MGSTAVALVSLGKFIVKLDIARQAYPDMGTFDQIVTQHPLFRKTTGQYATEGAHVIDPLAMVRPFAAQILIHIGDRLGVRVDADSIAEEPAEYRYARARQGRADARLNDGVAGHDAAIGCEARLVEGMGQCFDHSAGSCVRQLGIAVQGDHEAYIRKMLRIPDINQGCRGFRPSSVDQSVQLFQLAPLALPTYIFLLGLAPDAFTMKKEKTFASMTVIKLC